MKTEVMTITPQLAKKMLEKNNSNRPLSERTIRTFAESMRRGEWILTHQGIALSETNEVIDGQHRLNAVILADMDVDFIVFKNCKQESFKAVDIGLRRTNGHIFAICDIANYNRVASGISTYLTLKRNLTVGNNSRSKELGLTPTLLLDEYENNKQFYHEVSAISGRMYSKLRSFRASFIFGFICYAVLDKKHTLNYVENFMWALLGKNETNYFHNAKILFHILIKDLVSNKKLTSYIKQMLVFKAFNYDFEGKKMKLIKFDQERELKIDLLKNIDL
jgi:hydrogenase maturation factor